MSVFCSFILLSRKSENICLSLFLQLIPTADHIPVTIKSKRLFQIMKQPPYLLDQYIKLWLLLIRY